MQIITRRRRVDFLDLRDYGARLDGTSDDGPAWQRAFNAAGAGKGRSIFCAASPNPSLILTPVVTPNPPVTDGQLRVFGEGSGSRVKANVGAGNDVFTLSGWKSTIFEKLTIVGRDPTNATLIDCRHFLVSDAWYSIVQDMQSFGSLCNGALYKIGSGVMQRCGTYGGSFGIGLSCPAVWFTSGPHAVMRDCNFLDYGNLDNVFWSRTPAGVFRWFGATASTTGATSTDPYSVIVDGCGFDEGASAIELRPVIMGGSGWQRIILRDNNAMVPDPYGSFFAFVATFGECVLERNRCYFRRPISGDPVNGGSWLLVAQLGNTAVIRNCNSQKVTAGQSVVLATDLTGAYVEESSDVDMVYPNPFSGGAGTWPPTRVARTAGVGQWVFCNGAGLAYETLVRDPGRGDLWYKKAPAASAAADVCGALLADTVAVSTGDTTVRQGPTAMTPGLPVNLISDGTTAIANGDCLGPSLTVAGRVMKVAFAAGGQIARSTTTAAAVAGTIVKATWDPR